MMMIKMKEEKFIKPMMRMKMKEKERTSRKITTRKGDGLVMMMMRDTTLMMKAESIKKESITKSRTKKKGNHIF